MRQLDTKKGKIQVKRHAEKYGWFAGCYNRQQNHHMPLNKFITGGYRLSAAITAINIITRFEAPGSSEFIRLFNAVCMTRINCRT